MCQTDIMIKIDGIRPQRNSAVLLMNINKHCYISSNDLSYRINHIYLGIGATIDKNTDTGRELSELINLGNKSKIEAFLEAIVFKYASADRLKREIARAIDYARGEGINDATKQMRIALGL